MKLYYKTLLIFSTLLLLISCSSTKKIISEKPDQKEVVTDTIIKNIPPPPKAPEVIEDNYETEVCDGYHGNNIIEQFNHTIFNNLLEENISEKGETNYKGFIKNKTIFKSYLIALSENMPAEKWTKEDKLAYWMNTYNAFTIKLIIDNYPTKSIKDIKNAWDSRFFKLGSKWYNLSDIEHKILRKMNDPRIHFGINCASFSCPPLLNRAFTANNVHNELDFLAHQFINDKSRNTISENSIQLSKIFQWYAKDFKTEGSLIDYLNKYTDITIENNAKKSFRKYDWNLNEAHNGH
jgi:hypothetical protein